MKEQIKIWEFDNGESKLFAGVGKESKDYFVNLVPGDKLNMALISSHDGSPMVEYEGEILVPINKYKEYRLAQDPDQKEMYEKLFSNVTSLLDLAVKEEGLN